MRTFGFNSMDVRFLLLYIVFFSICICKQSTPSPVPTLQRASFTLDAALVEIVHKGSSHGSHSLAVEEENGKPEGLITVHESEGAHMVSPSTGVFPLARRLLLFGERKFLAIKAQDDKEKQPAKTGSASAAEKGLSADAKLLDDNTLNNSTGHEANPGDKETHPTDVKQSAPPPPFKSEDDTHTTLMEGKETEVNNLMPSSEKSGDQMKKDEKETKPSAPAIHCGGSQCEDPKKLVSACLRIPGDGALKLSLFITYEGDSEVTAKIIAPAYLTADLHRVLLLKGKSVTIQFMMDSKYESSMLDFDAVKNKTITVNTVYGDCQIAVPKEYLRNSVQEQKPQFSSYIPLVNPRVVAYLLVFVLIVALVGAWSCYKCCGKKRAGDAVKYQQLEMIAPGQSTPKERAESSTDRWDEVWDDDWEDAEAAKSSSRLTQSLSSRARRGNKDGWDTSWDD